MALGLAFRALRMAFGGAARTAPSATTRPGALGFAGRHPIITTGAGVGLDQTLNDGNLTDGPLSWLGGQFLDAVTPENGGDWMQLIAGGLAATYAASAAMGNGGLIGAALLTAAAINMDKILEFADPLLNEYLGIDIPDHWYRDGDAEAAAEDDGAVVERETTIPRVERAPTGPEPGM